jgi:hypothetical protein
VECGITSVARPLKPDVWQFLKEENGSIILEVLEESRHKIIVVLERRDAL